jgi:hypothetical protein
MSGSKKNGMKKSSAKRWVKGIALFATLGWIVVSLLITDKIQAKEMNGSLHNALVRSQTARHFLLQDLKRMSEEVDALHKKLVKYQTRETQAAANP